MATITCADAETLINEAASLGCRSPREQELAKLALENRIANSLIAGGASSGAYRHVETSGSITTTDYLIIADASGGAITLNLPQASTVAGRIYAFKRISSGANAVTIDGYGAETIDGAATHVLTPQWNGVTIMSDGTAWFILADH